jgi:hypothetical protein
MVLLRSENSVFRHRQCMDLSNAQGIGSRRAGNPRMLSQSQRSIKVDIDKKEAITPF